MVSVTVCVPFGKCLQPTPLFDISRVSGIGKMELSVDGCAGSKSQVFVTEDLRELALCKLLIMTN